MSLLIRALMLALVATPAGAIADAGHRHVVDDGAVTQRPDAALRRALRRQAPTLRPEVLDRGLRAYSRLATEGHLQRPVLTIIDYDLPSTEKRLWTFDIASKRLLFFELVAHGKGSGDVLATRFSNEPGSLASSIGLFVTGRTYFGRHGLSLVLHGLEQGYNDNASRRAIVIHGAAYAEASFVKKRGQLGRSWGCPAVRPAVARALIHAVAGGSAVFVHASNPAWLARNAANPVSASQL